MFSVYNMLEKFIIKVRQNDVLHLKKTNIYQFEILFDITVIRFLRGKKKKVLKKNNAFHSEIINHISFFKNNFI